MTHAVALDLVMKSVTGQFCPSIPNGWLLGWDVERYVGVLRAASQPYYVRNHTSFDYCFCNWYEVSADRPGNGGFWTLTAKLSFVAPFYSVHWTEYESAEQGKVIDDAPVQLKGLDQRVRSGIESVGFSEFPNDWYNVVVPGIELELSESRNVTLDKCLFCDYDS